MIAAAVHWSRRNLFAKPFDTALSLVVIPLCAWVLFASATWVLQEAQWSIIPESIRVLLVGIYPADQVWRAWGALLVFGLLFGATLGCVFFLHRWLAVGYCLIVATFAVAAGYRDTTAALLIVAAAALALGGWFATSQWAAIRRFLVPVWGVGLIAVFALLSPPGIGLWGGLMLSILITVVTAFLSLPIGILLAFGRRSKLASVRMFCTAYIETMRSVPLILVVYCVWIVLPVLAPQYSVPDVLRGMAGFTIFFSAYVAEYVRSGLQAVPKGQVEAARSLGMSGFDVNRYIVLPQALRVIVPPLVGNVLDVFNAAPLVFIIGLTDFLRAGQMVLANPQYSDRTYEIYIFLFVTYFLIGSLITFAARKLELHLAKGSR
ncbi:amino acid ABC transporter permease [Pseudaminobacter sp. NGMCC 1.201702]|uniref:amino acid ABC transporter permease n=1 Tax=Pseudaminobacter sp. NGMCC 1.201702 TaxID=3391825 RepID=UPI0039EEA3A0